MPVVSCEICYGPVFSSQRGKDSTPTFRINAMFAYPQSEQVRFHPPRMFETSKRVGQFARPKLGRESHCETNM